MTDLVNPPHYTRLDPEPIEVIESWGLSFCLGNALKYIARAGHKPGANRATDLRKALWYLDRELTRCMGAYPLLSENELALDEIATAQAEAKRWAIVARESGRRIRELEQQLVTAGLREVRDNAPPPEDITALFDTGGEAG